MMQSAFFLNILKRFEQVRSTIQALGKRWHALVQKILGFVHLHAALLRKIYSCIAYAFVAIIAIYSMHYVWVNAESSHSTHPASFLSTIESLVHRRTFAIDGSIGSDDSFVYEGKTYSTKPILIGTVGAIFYSAYKAYTHTPDFPIQAINRFMGGVPHIVFLVFFFFLCRRFIRSKLAMILTYAGGAIGNIMLLYATGVQRHTIAAAIVTIILFAFYRVYDKKDRRYSWMVLGFFLGLLPVIDPPYLAFAGVISVISLYRSPRNFLIRSVPCALIPLGIHAFLMWLAFGKINVAPYSIAQKMENPNNVVHAVFARYKLFDKPRYIYAFNMTFGGYGLFVATPLLLLGLYESIKVFFARTVEPAVRLLARVALFVFTVTFSFYLLYTNDYGGMSFSLRWLIPCFPMLLLLAGIWLDRRMGILTVFTFAVCLYFGAYHSHGYKSGWSHATFQEGDVLVMALRSKLERVNDGFKRYSWSYLSRPFTLPKKGCCSN